ncbi:acetate--CoA ligase family protein [Serratia ureilytica]
MAPENQVAVALPPLNMALARYLVLQAVKGGKIAAAAALRPDIPGRACWCRSQPDPRLPGDRPLDILVLASRQRIPPCWTFRCSSRRSAAIRRRGWRFALIRMSWKKPSR